MQNRLSGKTAMVVGAASGIGAAIAQRLAVEGASVACVDLQADPGDQDVILSPRHADIGFRYGLPVNAVVQGIRGTGGKALGIQADIVNEDSCDEAFWHAKRLLGPVDVLVNVAVQTYFLPFVEFPAGFWRRMFDVNVHGVFNMCQRALPAMIAAKSGAIVNIGSHAVVGSGRGPYPNGVESRSDLGPPTGYGASKAAVERLTQGLAEEMYVHGISVSCVAPSTTVPSEGAQYLHVKGRMSEPADYMADAVLLLATEPLDRVTGRVTYSQAILKEFGWIDEARGAGIDVPGSGFSLR